MQPGASIPPTAMTQPRISVTHFASPGVPLDATDCSWFWGRTIRQRNGYAGRRNSTSAVCTPSARNAVIALHYHGRHFSRCRTLLHACTWCNDWTDWPQYLRVGWGRQVINSAIFFWKSNQGFRCWQTPKFGISHWLLLVVFTTLSHCGVSVWYAWKCTRLNFNSNVLGELREPDSLKRSNALWSVWWLKQQESRTVAWKPRDATAVLSGLKFADNIHCKFKSSH